MNSTLRSKADQHPPSQSDDAGEPAGTSLLSEEQRAQLRSLAETAAALHGRASTVAEAFTGRLAVFTGSSGTGKTMAAEVLANQAGAQLLRVNLGQIASKYIGETEKNLRTIFAAAADSGAVLFFDEADALFGRRTEVKDGHDRYANLASNFLLQQIEAHPGLVIIACNAAPPDLAPMGHIIHFGDAAAE